MQKYGLTRSTIAGPSGKSGRSLLRKLIWWSRLNQCSVLVRTSYNVIIGPLSGFAISFDAITIIKICKFVNKGF